jgi:hypothetical protein
MCSPGFSHRYRNGEISRKHGNTLVRSMRRVAQKREVVR